MKKMRSSEKVTQKMTRSGAVLENLATGEVTQISRREAEEDFSAPKEATTLDATLEQASLAHTWHGERKASKESTKAVQEGSDVWSGPSSRLQFSEEERADPALQKYIRRSERAVDKLDAAKATIPTRKVPVKQRGFDEATGSFKTAIRFESVEKVPNGKLRHNPLTRPLQEIGLAAHGEVHKVEQDNVGVEAGHRAEEMSEHSVLYAGSKVREAALHHQTKPWRDAAKAEKEAIRANGEYQYRKAVRDDPSFSSSNPVSRYLHKRRIQREAARQFRQTHNAAHTARGFASRAKEAAQAAVSFARYHSNLLLPVLGVGLILVMLMGGVSSCSMMAGSGVSSVLSTSYLSEDADILAAQAGTEGAL